MRQINFYYSDPLDIIWTKLSNQLGFEVVRDPEVFASFDGENVLRIGTPESLDPDDSLGQMVLHEVCHALVEGPQALRTPDWGLDFDNPKHRVHEFATLRLQAFFADQFSMRNFFASTTDFRWYFDLIPHDSLHSEILPGKIAESIGWGEGLGEAHGLSRLEFESVLADDRAAIEMAQCGWSTASREKWKDPIFSALERTASLANVVREISPAQSLWK